MKMSYEQWLETKKEYSGKEKCFVNGCDKPAFYEGGDARYYCGMCEEHAGMKMKYQWYLGGDTKEPVIAGTW